MSKAWIVTALAVGGLAIATATSGAAPAKAGLQIKVLSSPRADLVSGGAALIEVTRVGTGSVKLTVNGEASDALHADADRHSLVGLVSGLKMGPNALAATSGKATAALTVVNHSSGGPILSGPHIMPYECRTVESGLGVAADADCNAPTKVDYFFRAADNSWKPLATGAKPPADVKTTTTIDGKTVPYVVRVESGTVNRTIYRIGVLDDPASPQGEAWKPGAAWNHRLAVSFGGGAGAKYNQGTNKAEDVLTDLFLSRGFAHVVATELVNNLHANPIVQGESLMMIKEHFIEHYGLPKWTVGFGGSGGAIQQLEITQIYPGLLNGLQPSLSFPDSTLHTPDCGILQNYWKTADGKIWTAEKKQAVDGFTPGTCQAWERSFVPVGKSGNKPGCDLKDQTLIYDPKTNPKGARCALNDWRVNQLGRDDKTGFARKVDDNIGLQYGLKGLNDGKLSVDEFLDVNEKVGGYTLDGDFSPIRSSGDVVGIRKTYESGLMNSGGGGLKFVPIIHQRTYNDPLGDIHSRERDMSIRARLIKANGDGDNEVFWVGPGATPGAARGTTPPANRANLAALSLDSMTQWLDAMAADPSPLTHAKVVKHRPSTAVDAYFDKDGVKHAEVATWDKSGGYNDMYPNHSEPRIVAGAPIANDVLKCQLKPIRAADYKVSFSAEQMKRLRAIFPTGVCDFSKPGVGQVALKGTYQKY